MTSRKSDRIFLEALEIKCIIGIFDWERKKKQKVLIDIDFPADIRRAAKKDHIRDTVDYKRMAKRTIHFVSQSRFQLIETLAERLAQIILKEFSLSELTLRVSKPGAVRGSKNVGVLITRKRSPRKIKKDR
ncbi:MAG: dihydroneopterin aldolase [Candidatus Omnitrophica bacterium]|nr:dihydroneopterin aldolase [Candidatus Omnitrophota bacterium]